MALWGVDIKKEVGGRSLKKIQFVHLNFLMTFLVIYYKFSNLGKFINFPLVSEKNIFSRELWLKMFCKVINVKRTVIMEEARMDASTMSKRLCGVLRTSSTSVHARLHH